jgi:spermidine/putrescine transport system permease protein
MYKRFLSYPHIVWMGIFIIAPMLLVLFYSLTIVENDHLYFTFEHFIRFVDPIYLGVLLRSVWLALIATFVCLILGYPLAYILANSIFAKKHSLLFLIVVPMWMNFLLRTYAWMTILENTGILNSILEAMGFSRIQFMYNQGAVVFGMVYNFIPFMILPIHSVLVKIDPSLIEAAKDLGAGSKRIFGKVIFPLSLPGIISGITMVFMPAVTTFVISRLLGGGQFTLIGNLIEKQFVYVGDWNFGSSMSIILMILILISMRFMPRDEAAKGGGFL